MKEKGCKVEGCEGKHCTKGYCKRHYIQIRRHGKIIKTRVDRNKWCNVNGCGRKVHGRGLCSRHYAQLLRGGVLKRTIKDLNEFIVEQNVAYIQLYNKQCQPIKRAIIDREDVIKCRNYKWSFKSGYVTSFINGKKLFLHNFVMNHDASSKNQMDHKNRMPLDCRKSNLRICTPNENKYNEQIRRNNKSGFRGVYFDRRSNKWIVEIVANKKRYWIGSFNDKIEAARVWDKMALELHGEFACLNFPVKENRI